MSATKSAQLLRGAAEGERVRSAVRALEHEGSALLGGLRRALPFLSRRGVLMTRAPARAASLDEALEGKARPLHRVPFLAEPTTTAGALVFDGTAMATLLDGTLGGNGTCIAELDVAGATSPQIALLGRVASGILEAFSEVLLARLGIRLAAMAPATSQEAPNDGAPILLTFQIGEDGTGGLVVLAIPKDALLHRADRGGDNAATGSDARLGLALEQAELELVAELGRLPMRLGAVTSLKVGDVLRLDVPVEGMISVRAEQRIVFSGRPTSVAGRLAVRIVAAHVGDSAALAVRASDLASPLAPLGSLA